MDQEICRCRACQEYRSASERGDIANKALKMLEALCKDIQLTIDSADTKRTTAHYYPQMEYAIEPPPLELCVRSSPIKCVCTHCTHCTLKRIMDEYNKITDADGVTSIRDAENFFRFMEEERRARR